MSWTRTPTSSPPADAALAIAHQRREELSRLAPGDADSAGLRVQQANDQIRSLEEKLRSATVIAPADAILYSLPVRVGDYVTVGETIAGIGRPAPGACSRLRR
jgi:multidrug resistance efflux pump